MDPTFRRYTNLAATIHLLHQKKITLLNPATWDDKNDAYFMAEYKRLKSAKTVLALCFAESMETYHHWRVFSSGADGVCIVFNKAKILSAFDGDSHIAKKNVSYETINAMKKLTSVDCEALPFLKRIPYQDEMEYRVVYTDTEAVMQHKEYGINIEWIVRIILSPWFSKALRDSVKSTLRTIKGCSKLKLTQSTLIDNEEWKNLTARVLMK